MMDGVNLRERRVPSMDIGIESKVAGDSAEEARRMIPSHVALVFVRAHVIL